MSASYQVWKYPVPLTDEFVIDMPEAAQILDVQVQQDKPVLWALVRPDAPEAERRFRLVGTGHPVSGDDRYQLIPLGTIQLAGGALVFHLFEYREA